MDSIHSPASPFRGTAQLPMRALGGLFERHPDATLVAIELAEGLLLRTASSAEGAPGARHQPDADAWQLFPPALEMIEEARRRGARVLAIARGAELDPLDLARFPALDAVERISIEDDVQLAGRLRALAAGSSGRVLYLGRASACAQLARTSRAGEKIEAVELILHGGKMAELSRLVRATSRFIAPGARVHQPYRGLLGGEKAEQDPMGYAAMGLILHPFARWLLGEEAMLRAEGRRPRLLYLMRDGWLIRKVTDAVAGRETGVDLCVSRFVAQAASMRSADEVRRYLARYDYLPPEALARQLLLPAELSARLRERSARDRDPQRAFLGLLLAPGVLQVILERSRAYRARFLKHLDRVAAPREGETMVMVDLGYDGTIPARLAGFLKDERGVEVETRFLVNASSPGWNRARRGMIDPAWCDDRVINVLRAQINVIEQLCSAPVGSIVDFTENGDPVHSDNSRLARQLESIVPMQERCVEFARDAEAWFAAGGTRPSEEALALSSAAVLAQQGFFPSAGQLEALEGFQHDYNVGTDEVFSIFDPRRGLAQLRRGGLASVMNQDRGGPLERRAAGLEVAMPGVSLLRFGSFAAGNDGPVRAERLPVIALSAGGQRQEQLTAPATHDGFFLLQMNLTPGTTLAVNLGRAYRWLQIESIEACCGEKPGAPGEPATRVDLLAQTRMDNLLSRGEDIYQCMSEQALLIAPPPPPPRSDGRWTLRILFRPLERREAAPRPLAAIA